MTASLHLHRNRNRISLRTLIASERVQQHDCDVITQYRDEIYARMPDAAQGALNAFISAIFGDDGPGAPIFIPWQLPAESHDHASDLANAPNQASCYPRLLQLPRKRVGSSRRLCAILWLLLVCHQQVLGRPAAQNAETMRLLSQPHSLGTQSVTGRALRQPRRCHADLGYTLAQVLGWNMTTRLTRQQVGAYTVAALGSGMMQMP